MSEPSVERPARRFLHICYCCADDQQVASFFVEGLKMQAKMRTTDRYDAGAILGIDHDVRSPTTFVYDHRGPRVSPAVEVQGWIDPPLEGTPSVDPFEIGIKALGFAVPSVDEAVERLEAMGCTGVFDGGSTFGERHATLLDPRQVTLELVEDGLLALDATQLHHLRITVSDLDASLPFYEMLGFDVIGREAFSDAAFVGHHDEVEARFARLRLAEEPFEVRLIQWHHPSGHGHHYDRPNHAGLFRTAMRVDDTRASYEHLTATGAVFDRPPAVVELSGTPVPDMWITFISDPDGLPYEFVQRPADAFR